jgi:hypothetical protein
MRSHLNWLFVICFCICSVAAVAQKAFFSQEISADDAKGSCTKINNKRRGSCSRSWSTSWAEGYEKAISDNSFGPQRAYAYSEVTCIKDQCSTWDQGLVDENTFDWLSILGLMHKPKAFLKVDIVCLECAVYLNGSAKNVLRLRGTSKLLGECTVQRPSGPRCTVKIRIAYKNQQPVPVELIRTLWAVASTNVVNAPAGAKVTTLVTIGYPSGGATVSASVVDTHGRIIKGVTVVGASGHLYN